MSFWFVRIENLLVIFQSMYEAGRWPVGIYPQWLQFALTSLVPIAFAVTVPAEALTARLTVQSFAFALVLELWMRHLVSGALVSSITAARRLNPLVHYHSAGHHTEPGHSPNY